MIAKPRFNQVPTEGALKDLEDLARHGSVDKLRDLLRGPEFWTATERQRSAIALCAGKVVPEEEELIKGYELVSVNKKFALQERILLVTTQAFYRINYDWKKSEVVRYTRILMEDVEYVSYGRLRTSGSKLNIANAMMKTLIEKGDYHGFRYFISKYTVDAGINDRSRILIPLLPDDHEHGQDRKVAAELAFLFGAFGIEVVNLVIPFQPTVASAAYNATVGRVGSWRQKRGKDD